MTPGPREPERKPGDTFAGFLTGDTSRDRRNVDMLLDTIAQVSSSVRIEEILVSVVDKALGLTGAERGILMLYDDRGELRVRVARDSLGRDLGGDLRYSHTIPQKVAREGRAVCHLDTTSANPASLGQSIMDLRLVTVMCVPPKVKDRTIGVLYVDSRALSGEGFTDSDLTLFKALSYQLAIAIENARLLNAELEKERMQQSLQIAREVQQSLLPPGGLSLPGFDIHGISRPCEETGGDYFDYIRVRDSHVGLVVGDVSGHGIDAALFMATGRALLRAFVTTRQELSEVIADLNNALERDMGTGRFMTLFYGDLDVRERLLRYVRAGHNAPVLYRSETGEFEDLSEGGMALGFVRNMRYRTAGPVVLGPGDILLLYTDGIPEARDTAKNQFGVERMLEAVREGRDRAAREIVEGILDRVAAFTEGAPIEDDLTLIVCKGVDGPASGAAGDR